MTNFVKICIIDIGKTKGPFGFGGGGRRESRGNIVELAENKLILGQIYAALLPLLPPQSKRTLSLVLAFHYYLHNHAHLLSLS